MIFCTDHAKWSRVVVMKLVDMLVERAIVKSTMGPVMPEILKEEENTNLDSHCFPSGGENTHEYDVKIGRVVDSVGW